jgi:hypothetical protein
LGKFCQLHLWIGLLTSILILIEAVTGLLLSEPSLMGQSSRPDMKMVMQGGAANNQSQGATEDGGGQTGNSISRPQQGSSFVGFIHGLHEGRIGSTNVKWLADVAAIGLIILTLTGISLSIQTLRAQSRSRKRRNAGASSGLPN